MYLDWLRLFWLFYFVMFIYNFFVLFGLIIVVMLVMYKFGLNCVFFVVKIVILCDNGESMGIKF